MIKANELRIGNLIQRIEYGKAIRYNVDPLLIEAIRKWPGSHGFCPIPLTPEWLERLEFESESERSYIFEYRDREYFTIGWRDDLSDGDGAVWLYPVIEGMMSLPHIKSVHQLQNLFFVLTGDELTVKEASHAS